jgi:hypothetical protein
MSVRTKEIAKAVDDCLAELLGGNVQINLTAALLEKWEIAVGKLGIKLSLQKIKAAIVNLGITVLKITVCADDWMCDRNWKELNLAH